VKYPYESTLAGTKGKFGFFVSEEEHYKKVATELGILNKGDGRHVKYCRHPLVYLVEAADDICYQIMDIEDSHKLKILTTNQTKKYLLAFFNEEKMAHVEEILSMIEDKNEQIAYLRSSIVGLLVDECSKAFIEHEDEILRGDCTSPLINMISETPRKAYEACSAMAYEKIYNYSGVLDIELAGNQIVNMLLDKLIDAVLHPDKSYSKLLLAKVPQQYDMGAADIPTRIQAVTDYISGMTDVYALDLYQKLNGMSLPVI
jgi:dGTPase